MTKLFMVVNDPKEVQEHNLLMKMTNRVDQEDSFIDILRDGEGSERVINYVEKAISDQ